MEKPCYTLGPFWSSERNKDSQLNVFVSNKHFQIELKASNFEKSPRLLADYLRHLEHLDPDYLPELEEDFEDPLEELAGWVLQCFLPIFREIPPLDIHRKYTLHDCLFPEVFHYSLYADQGKLLPIFLDRTGSERFMGALLPESEQVDYSIFPIYRPDEIEIPISDKSIALPAIPRKVFIKYNALRKASRTYDECAHPVNKAHGLSITHTSTDIDPHNYKSGRWLRHDEQEREMRYIGFDFGALCEKILNLCPRASSISNCEKIEGGFNLVFIFTMNDSKRIVARLPFALAGPSRLTTSSEVATIKFCASSSHRITARSCEFITDSGTVQAKTSIPIPAILDWNNDSSNPIKSEYIIMEHVDGVQLQKKWPEMTGDMRVRCINEIYRKLKEMADLEFPAYGSVDFEGNLQSGREANLGGGFSVGPHCASRYWNCNIGEPRYYHNTRPNQGPWTTLAKYCDGLVDAGISGIPPRDPTDERRPYYHGSVQTHLELLECSRSVLKEICADPRIQAATTPTLFHPDLHKRNVFVSDDNPSKITGIIDWQSASIEPAFWYADEVPDFAIPDESENNICAKAFDVCSRFLIPKISGPRLMDENLFRPFLYSYRTWKDGAVALHHELIETTRRWNELGFAGSSPFALPSPNEVARHEREYKLFVAAQELKHDLSNLLDSATDGWVPSDNWETTKSSHREIFDGMLTAVLTNKNLDHEEPVKDEGILRSIWPFDLET